MKKCVLAAFTLALLVTACGKEEKANKPDTVPDQPGNEETQQPETPPDNVDPVPEELTAVDLGLSVSWGSINLGGVAWGETAPKQDYSWTGYRWGNPPSKYNMADGKTILDPEDDKASVQESGLWHMPTLEDWKELASTSNTEWVWGKKNDVNGYTITSKKNGNSIFLPATDGPLNGLYWSSTLLEPTYAASLQFDNASPEAGTPNLRYIGLEVRPVYGPVFRIVTQPATLSSEAQTLEVEIVSNLGYEISSLPDWMKESGDSEAGLNRHIHRFAVSANEAEESRNGIIVFCNENNNCVPFSVTQNTFVPELSVTPESLSFSCLEGSSYLDVNSNGDWKVTCSEPWCEIMPASGSGNAQLSVGVAANDGKEVRQAQVQITLADGSITRTVTVTQDAYDATAAGVDWNKSFYHRSLVMRFTATWCGYCPLMATALHAAMEKAPGKLVPLNLHGNGSDLVFNKVSILMNQYAIEGYPSGIVDGRRDVPNYNDYNVTASKIVSFMEETEAYYPVASAIGVESALEGRQLDADVLLFLRYPDDYKVTVILTESGIIGKQTDYMAGVTHTDYQHDDVARVAMSSVLGDDITTTEEQTGIKRHYSVTVPTQYNLDNLQLVVYVQRAFGSQTVIASGDYGGYYADNAVAVPVGETRMPDYAD